MRDALGWVLHSRARFAAVLGTVAALLVAVMVANLSSGAAQPTGAASPTPSPSPTAVAQWLQPTTPTPSAATATPSASVTASAEAAVVDVARGFTTAFLDRTLPPEQWRAAVVKWTTPELGAAFTSADPAKVPILAGTPTFAVVRLTQGDAETVAEFADGGLRITTTTDGSRWSVANVLPLT